MTKELKTIRVYRPMLPTASAWALLTQGGGKLSTQTEHKDFQAHGVLVAHDGHLELLRNTGKTGMNDEPMRSPFACFHKDHWVYYEIIDGSDQAQQG